MSVIDINKYRKNVTLKNKLIIGIILIIIILIIVATCTYIKVDSFREWVDTYIFRKNIENTDIACIDIDSSNNPSVYAFDKYITVLEKNMLSMYNSSGSKTGEIEVNVSNPIYNSNNKYLCIAESKGNNIYLVSGGNLLWQTSVDGTIEKINVNKNGYVSVIEKGTSYKNIIIIFNSEGKELFKTYLSSSIAVATDISGNNQHLAIAEVDTTGAMIQSNIKIISIEKAKSDPTNSVEHSISGDTGELITNIKYQDKEKLICIYDNSINLIENGKDSEILKLENKTIMADIKNKNNIVYVREKSNNIFSTSRDLVIKNIQNNNEINYEVEGTIKYLQVYDANIVINLGTEAEFINTLGWLQKKYKSKQEISNIVLGSSVAGVVYRDRVEIINL